MEFEKYSPYDVVHADDALRLLLLVHDGRLRHHPAVAARAGEKPVPVGLRLSFANGCNAGREGEERTT